MSFKSTVYVIIISFVIQYNGLGQVIGGQKVYEFLNYPASARITALGGTLIAVQDSDVSLAMLNPASLNNDMAGQFHFSHNFHFAGLTHGVFNTAKQIDKLGLVAHAGIQYSSYGDFVLSDEIGNKLGSFSANEFALVLGAGKKINERIHVGMNLKLISSNFESYSSYGIATDLAASYENPDSRFMATLLVRSLGTQLSSYNGINEQTPLDIQIGISKKLEHLPFRISITAHQLQQWNIRYDDASINETTNLFGEETETSELSKDIDNLFRHLVFSGEFLLGQKENLKLRFGYSHLRRKELSVSEFRSLAGFSLGFGLKITKFRIDYGLGYHHLVGSTNHISIATNLSEFRKKV